MSSKEQYRDALKKDKQTIRELTEKKKQLETELNRVQNMLYTRGIQPDAKVVIKNTKRKWWQFWK